MSKIPKSYGVDRPLCVFKVWSNRGIRSFDVNGLQINLGFLVLICQGVTGFNSKKKKKHTG